MIYSAIILYFLKKSFSYPSLKKQPTQKKFLTFWKNRLGEADKQIKEIEEISLKSFFIKSSPHFKMAADKTGKLKKNPCTPG